MIHLHLSISSLGQSGNAKSDASASLIDSLTQFSWANSTANSCQNKPFEFGR